MQNSALSWTTKKMALAGEVTRRLLNTSPELVEEGLAECFIEEFEYKMCLSGYYQRERITFCGTGGLVTVTLFSSLKEAIDQFTDQLNGTRREEVCLSCNLKMGGTDHKCILFYLFKQRLGRYSRNKFKK